MFPAGDGGGGDDYGDQPQQQQQEQTDSNPVKVGHTFEMLPHPNIDKYGMSPLPLNHMDIVNLGKHQAYGLVSPPHSAVVYRLHDIHVIFLALLLIQVANRLTCSGACRLVGDRGGGMRFELKR